MKRVVAGRNPALQLIPALKRDQRQDRPQMTVTPFWQSVDFRINIRPVLQELFLSQLDLFSSVERYDNCSIHLPSSPFPRNNTPARRPPLNLAAVFTFNYFNC